MITKKLILTFTTLVALATAVAMSTSVFAASINVGPGDDLQDAIDNATAGDTILLAAGTYSGNYVIDKQLTIKGAQAGVDGNDQSGAETVIRSQNGTASNRPGFNIQADNVTIDGITFDGSDVTSGNSIGVYAYNTDSKNLQVYNSVFIHNYVGVKMLTTDASGLVVRNSLFADNEANGVDVGQGSVGSGIVIADNTFKNTGIYAIIINSNVGTLTDVEVAGNTSTDDASFLVIRSVDGVVISSNIVNGLADFAVQVRDGVKNAVIENNTLRNGQKGIWFIGIEGTTDNINITGNTITGMSEAGILGYADRDIAAKDGIVVQKNNISGNEIGVSNASNVAIKADDNYWGCAAGPGAEGCDNIDGMVLAGVWYTNSDMTTTNVDDDSAAPGVPNTSSARTMDMLLIGAGVIVTAAASVLTVRHYMRTV